MTEYNYKDFQYSPDDTVLTQPDQTLSVREIIKRFVLGQDLPYMYESNDDDQTLTEDEQLNLHVVEDDFELRDFILEGSASQQAPEGIGKAGADPDGNNNRSEEESSSNDNNVE